MDRPLVGLVYDDYSKLAEVLVSERSHTKDARNIIMNDPNRSEAAIKEDLSSRTPSCNENPDISEAVVQCGVVLLPLVLLVLHDL